MPILKGQQYEINSFDMGFINMPTIEMLVTVTDVDYTSRTIQLNPGLEGHFTPTNTFFCIFKWFRDEYPVKRKGAIYLNDLNAFNKLVEARVAVLHGKG